jgi:hypothetical protein
MRDNPASPYYRKVVERGHEWENEFRPMSRHVVLECGHWTTQPECGEAYRQGIICEKCRDEALMAVAERLGVTPGDELELLLLVEKLAERVKRLEDGLKG